MRGEKGPHLLRLMRRQVVEDDVHFPSARLRVDDLGEEGEEVLAGVARGRLPDDLASARVERGIEGERPVPVVFKAVALGAARRERKDGVESIERLNRGLLVEAEDRGVLWRIEVQPEDIGRLGLEVGIGRPHVALQSMRL